MNKMIMILLYSLMFAMTTFAVCGCANKSNKTSETVVMDTEVEIYADSEASGDKKIWHEPVYETITEEVPIYKDFEIMECVEYQKCDNCGKLLYGKEELLDHMGTYASDGTMCMSSSLYKLLKGTGEYSTEIWDYETVTKQVLVQEGYWE